MSTVVEIHTFSPTWLGNYSELPISSEFGNRRLGGKLRFHAGIDIAVPVGTEIKSPYEARVVSKKLNKKGHGLYVTIRYTPIDSFPIFVVFSHLSSVKDYINPGYKLQIGDLIGSTGGAVGHKFAGNSRGPHLHMEVMVGTVPVDPIPNFLARNTLKHLRTGKILVTANPLSRTFLSTGLVYKNQKLEIYTERDVEISNSEVQSEPVQNQPAGNKTTTNNKLAPGIWQITKLLVDSSVRNKQVADAGISTLTGSLLNFFKKVCQEPLVEFFGDTYGDQYYFIVRRPPFDQEGFKKMIENTQIVLDRSQIINTNLTYNNQGIYSWYQYLPTFDYVGSKDTNIIIPAVFFPEYASIWGSRVLSIESNYYNYLFSGKWNNNKEDIKKQNDNIAKNAYSDFKYLVECNAYVPFSRRGTITIIGDRRIKRGTVIQHVTGEVFYVDSVTNTFDPSVSGVNRITTLNVSRGLFPDLIYGRNINGKLYSYFNIIDFGNPTDVDYYTLKSNTSKWKVDKEVFGFFMRKEQVW